jgi:hypothetical protein
MAQKKKSNKNRQGNLPPLPPKQSKVSRQPMVGDVTDAEEDSEDDDFIPMDPTDSSDLSGEIEMESDDEDGGFKEIQSDVELMTFASRLKKAHDQMGKEEKEKRATKKRKATYTWQFRQVQMEVEARG